MQVAAAHSITRIKGQTHVPAPAAWLGQEGRKVNPVVNFFRVLTAKPDPFPPLAQTIRKAVQTLDFSHDRLVIWVPGTDESSVPSAFRQAVEGVLGLNASHITYPASYQLEQSASFGVKVLKGVLDYIREWERRTGRKFEILLAGHSQGAWVVSMLLADRKYEPMVTRAVMFGHPYLAKNHWHTNSHPKYLEINNPGDIVAFPFKGAEKDEVRDVMSSLSDGGLLKAIPFALRLAVKNPAALGTLAMSVFQLTVPGFKRNYDNVHDYGADMLTAVQFLKDGTRYGRANKQPERSGGVTDRARWRDPYMKKRSS